MLHESLLKTSILALALALALSACNSKVMKSAAGDVDGGNFKATGTISFEDVKTQALTSCIGCHTHHHNDYATYAGVIADVVKGDPSSSALFFRLKNNNGNMPKDEPQIPDAEANLIRDWITNGAPNTLDSVEGPKTPDATPSPSPTPEPPPVGATPPPTMTPPSRGIPTGPVSFDDLKTKVLGPRCLRCHGPDDDSDFSSIDTIKAFVVPGDASKSALFVRLINNGGDMPNKGKAIPDDEAELIKRWINEGALVGAPAPVPAPPAPAPQPTTTLNFATITAQVLGPKCVMCHSDARMGPKLSFENYDTLIANDRLVNLANPDASGLYASVTDDFMPPKKAVASKRAQVLTADEKALLKAWLEAGAPR